MSYNKVGVFGSTGILGQEITRALAEAGLEVVPFSRERTTVAGIPTQTLESLVGFDAVVSTVGHAGMKEQISLIERAKKDGVKRFVPSEFGVDHRVMKADFFKPKMEIFEAVEKANFPEGWTAIASGFFENMVPRFVEVQPKLSKIIVRGSGEKQYPYTVRHDIGRVLAHTFKHPQEYRDSWLVMANGWFSLNEIANMFRSQYGGSFDIEHVELDNTTPVLRLFELNDLNAFHRGSGNANLPVNLTDIKEYIQQIAWE